MFEPKFLLPCFLLLAFSVSVYSQTPKPTPPDTDEPEKIFTEEIKLNVSAIDREGNFVRDVRKEDLVINEDNILHQADSIRRIPANVLIILDTGGEMRQAKSIDHTRKTAKSLIAALRAEDSIAIIEYHDKARILAEWMTDRAFLNQILDSKLNFGRRSVFLDAIELAGGFLQKSKVDNQHLVLISDGTDSINKRSERDRAMNDLLASSVSVHVISYTRLEREKIDPKTKSTTKSPPPKAMPEEVIATLPQGVRDMVNAPKVGPTIVTDRGFLRKMRERQDALIEGEKFLSDLAENTSGQFVLPETREEMLAKTTLVAQVIDSNYVITYTPKRPLSEAKPGEVRSIEVTSKRPGLQVLSRRKLAVESN
jgi:VWFA-related protein